MPGIKGGGKGKQAIVRIAALAGGFSIGMVNLSMIFYARDILQMNPGRVGLMAASWCFCYAVASMGLRRIADRFPPRFLIAGAAALMGLCIFGLLATRSQRVVFAFYALFGTGMALFWPPLVGWLSVEAEGRHLSRLISRFNMSWSLGMIVSPYAAGRFYELRPVLPIVVGGGLMLANAIFVLTASAFLPTAGRDRNHRADEAGVSDDSTLYRFPAWAGLAATYFGMGVLNAVYPMVAREEAGFSESQVGVTLLAIGLCNFIGFILLGRFVFWHYKVSPMVLALTLRAAAFMALPWLSASPATALIAMTVFGFTLSMSYTSSIYHGVSGSLRKTRRMAIHESLIAASLVGGSFFGGRLYQYHSSWSVYMLAAAVCLLVAGAQTIFTLKQARA